MREFSLQQKMDAQGTHLSLGQLSFLPHFFERNNLAPALLRRVGRFRRGRCRCRFHEAADLLSRTSLHIVGDMRVGVQREPGAVVAQHAGQGLHIYAAGEGHRGKSMAQIMEANALLNAAFASSFRLILDTASGLQ